MEQLQMTPREVLECFDHPAWIWSLQGTWIAENDTARSLVCATELTAEAARLIEMTQTAEEFPVRSQLSFMQSDGTQRQMPCTVRPLPHTGEATAVIISCPEQQDRSPSAEQHPPKQTIDDLRHVAERMPAGFLLARTNPGKTTKIEYYNAQMYDLLGVTEAEFLEGSLTAFKNVHPEDMKKLMHIDEVAHLQAKPFSFRYRIEHPARGLIWAYVKGKPFHESDGSILWSSYTVDITTQVTLEHEAGEAHDRMQKIANTVPVGLYEVQLNSDGQPCLVYTSPRFEELLGLTATDPREKYMQLYDNIHPEDAQALYETANSARDNQQSFEMRFRRQKSHGDAPWVSVTANSYTDVKGNMALIGAAMDITPYVLREQELRRAYAQTERVRRENERLALHDPLTDLPNRRHFDTSLQELFSSTESNQAGMDVTLVRIDGDRFKYINDTYGHEAGDAVLKHIGTIMREETQPPDLPSRVGGDEFSILLPDDSLGIRAEQLVERIKKRLEVPLSFDGNRCAIQVSFGVASVNTREDSPEDLLAFADAALYRAKDAGRNRVELFTPSLRQQITDERRIVSDLHRAIEREQIHPYYHVQMDTKNGCLHGVETLMRWHHPTRGVLSPDTFLHLAEKLRMTADLDCEMRRKAHEELHKLRSKEIKIPRISFNAGAVHLKEQQIIADAKALIDDGFPVALELLESIMVEEESPAFHFALDTLRDLGVQLEIDDFGSGRASVLGLLEVSPVALKIDKRLISQIELSPSAQKLVRAIKDIADALEIETICEGVENMDQLESLQSLGCYTMQGYLFAKPLPLSGLIELLRAPPSSMAEHLRPTG